jgi:hypothetical protein
LATVTKGELSTLNLNTRAVDRLQRVCSELAEFHVELRESDIEPEALRVLQDTADQLRKTAWALQQGMEGQSTNKNGLEALLADERMRLASQLNRDIAEDLEAGRIRTDQDGLSAYMRVLNQAMERVDRVFGSRAASA